MNKKKLTVIFSILAVLVIAVIVKKTAKRETHLAQEVGFKKLVKKDVGTGDVFRIELYRGKDKDNKVVLVKKDDVWTVESKFGAPGKSDIAKFIEKITSMEGEFRAESKDVLSDFSLDDDEAIHMVFYGSTADKELVHVLVGKSTKGRNSFVRLANDNRIYSVDVNLNSQVGIFNAGDKESPKSDYWVDLVMLKMEKDKINQIDVETPTRNIVLARKLVVKEEKKEDAGEGIKSEPGKDLSKEAKVESKPEYKWVVAEGKIKDLKKDAVDQILSSVSNVYASSVVDPAQKSTYGLDSPPYKISIKTESGKDEVIVGSRPRGDENGYLILSGREDIIYKVNSFTFKNIFREGKDLFNLHGLEKNAEKIKKVEIVTPSWSYGLKRSDDNKEWTIQKPNKGLPVVQSAAVNISSAFARLTPVDYLDDEGNIRELLKNPTYSLTCAEADKATTTLKVAEKSIKGANVIFYQINNDMPMIMAEEDFKKIFPEKESLIDTKVVHFSRSDVEEIKFIKKNERFSLVKTDNIWSVKVEGGAESRPGDGAKVDDLLRSLASLGGRDVTINETKNPKKGAALGVRIRERNKGEKDLFVHEEGDSVWVQAPESKVMYVMEKGNASFLFHPIQFFVKQDTEEKKMDK